MAWPNIISNLLFTTVGFLHIKIVAGLGTSAVAAVTTGHRVFFLVQAILMGVSVAATALIARYWGASKLERAENGAWTSILLSVALAAVLSFPYFSRQAASPDCLAWMQKPPPLQQSLSSGWAYSTFSPQSI